MYFMGKFFLQFYSWVTTNHDASKTKIKIAWGKDRISLFQLLQLFQLFQQIQLFQLFQQFQLFQLFQLFQPNVAKASH